jgi:hypothetical protein
MSLVNHTPTLLTAAAGSGAAVATEVLPDSFFQILTQLFIGVVTIWKILSDNKKNENKPKNESDS